MSDDPSQFHKAKKLKSSYFQRKSLWKSISPGMKGILATCPRRHEKSCAQELLRLLCEYDASVEVTETNDNTSPIRNTSTNELEVEVSKLKAEEQFHSKFEILETHVECVVFIRVKSDKSVLSYIEGIVRYIQLNTCDIRFIQRVTPLEAICSANLKDLDKMAKSLIDVHFHGSQGPYKFAILFKSRNSQRLAKEETIHKIASMIGTPHTVDLDHPDKVIALEIFKNVVGLGIMDSYYESKKYNLTELSVQYRINISFGHG